MQCRGLAFRITWSILATTALVAKAIYWADYCFERSDIFDYDHDEVIAPLRLVDLQKKRRKSHGHDHDHGPGPVIPEPMVFDLVRPLNALQGQFEANVLAIFPMKRGPAGAAGLPDAIGAVPLPGKTQCIEWAPEFEWCPRDGVTLEAEW